MMSELQSTCYDLLPACIVSTSWPTVPVPPSLTLAAFATAGYVKDGPTLTYCAQEAHTVTLVGGDGNYWLALSQDSWTTYASWNRVPGTHYAWRASATRPPDVDGVLVFVSIVVSGGNITAVSPASGVTRAEALRALSGLGPLATLSSPLALADGGTGATTQAGARTNLGLGTMATQDAGAVAVTGGTATGLTPVSIGGGVEPTYNLTVHGSAFFWASLLMLYNRASTGALAIRPSADTGPGTAIGFLNAAGGFVGSITTTGTTTAYNTSSDARLKHAIAPLSGSLDVIAALNPISHLWNADDSYAENFLAHELQQVLAYAVTGEPDAVHADGSVRPQQVDASKIIPRLVGAFKELLAQVETLTARVTSLEEALGV